MDRWVERWPSRAGICRMPHVAYRTGVMQIDDKSKEKIGHVSLFEKANGPSVCSRFHKKNTPNPSHRPFSKLSVISCSQDILPEQDPVGLGRTESARYGNLVNRRNPQKHVVDRESFRNHTRLPRLHHAMGRTRPGTSQSTIPSTDEVFQHILNVYAGRPQYSPSDRSDRLETY